MEEKEAFLSAYGAKVLNPEGPVWYGSMTSASLDSIKHCTKSDS